MGCVDFRLVFVIVGIINTVENRRYDIEQQCRLEYGMDLKGVLRQFRRSDDYVRILEMRTKEFDTFFIDSIYQSYEWNLNKMKEEIQADFGFNTTTPAPKTTSTTTASSNDKLRLLKSRFNLRRDGSSGTAARDIRKTIVKVRRIDKHPKLNQFLTVIQRNHYKNIGFQYAGDIIHAVIFAFGGSPTDEGMHSGSTLMDARASNSTNSTTKHALRHTVEPLKIRASAEEQKSERHSVTRRRRE